MLDLRIARGRAAALTALFLAVAIPSSFHGQSIAKKNDAPTFTRDVAPILQQKCQVCHQPNSIGPMPLE